LILIYSAFCRDRVFFSRNRDKRYPSKLKVRLDFKEFFMKETIVAQATAPGRGGIGILRVSGPLATEVAQAVLFTREIVLA